MTGVGAARDVSVPVLGVDCGGGSTRAVLVRPGGGVERLDGPPLNVLLHADLAEVVARLVVESGAQLVGVGVPGLRGDAARAALAGRLRELCRRPVAVAEDVRTARIAAFAGGPGIVVIAGTGSNALGEDAAGRQARAGGHGFLLGDEGSGWWIGREAVRAALRDRDGLGPATALTARVEAAFGTLDGAVAGLHADPTDRTLLSRLTRPVADAAADGDEVAAATLDRAADELAALAGAVRRRLAAPSGGDAAGGLPVAMLGGVFAIERLRERFVASTGAHPAAEDPEWGAVRLALAELDPRPDPEEHR